MEKSENPTNNEGKDSGDSLKLTGEDCGDSLKLTGEDCGDSRKLTGKDCGDSRKLTGEDCGDYQKLTGEDCGDSRTLSGEDCGDSLKLTDEDCGDSLKCPLPVKASLRTRLKDQEFRAKCLRTLWYGAAFWALGFVLSQRGPAFLDLQIITRTNVEQASAFFTSSSAGYLLGSLVAGLVYERINKSLLMLLYLACMAVTTVATPWCSMYELMVAIHAIFSLFAGGLETVGNAEMVRVWGKEGEMALQFIHFSYAFGGVIAPLVTEPFLTPVPEKDDNSTATVTQSPFSVGEADVSPVLGNHSDSSYLVTCRPSNLTACIISSSSTTSSDKDMWNSSTASSVNTTTLQSLPESTRVHFAYMISGCLILLVMVPFSVQLFTDRSHKRRQTQQDQEKKVTKQPLPRCLFLFVVFLLCVFNFMNVAVEDTFSSYLLAFVVKQLHWSKSSGAEITSVFWAVFAVCRFLSIFAVHLLTSVRLLLLSCSALAVSTLLFTLCSLHGLHLGVWVSAALVGASIAAIFPTGFAWMEEELVRVTGRVASCAVISASAGSSASPVLLGFLMQRFTPMWFAYLMFGQGTACLLVFLFLLTLSRCYLRKHYNMKSQPQEVEVNSPSLQEDLKASEECKV